MKVPSPMPDDKMTLLETKESRSPFDANPFWGEPRSHFSKG